LIGDSLNKKYRKIISIKQVASQNIDLFNTSGGEIFASLEFRSF